jgi:chemotaxis signal transduction protein
LDLDFFKNLILTNIILKEQESKFIEPQSSTQIEVQDEIELICFTIDNFIFGVIITDLIEVIEGYGMQPLFRVNKMLRGLINLRGQIIACVDISEIIGLELRKMEEKSQYILIQNGNSDLALCIDNISKKQKFSRHDIQNVESIFSGELGEYLMGIIEKNSERIFVISVPKIFESKHLLSNRE